LSTFVQAFSKHNCQGVEQLPRHNHFQPGREYQLCDTFQGVENISAKLHLFTHDILAHTDNCYWHLQKKDLGRAGMQLYTDFSISTRERERERERDRKKHKK